MRKLTLYIKSKEVELNDEELILFNYAFGDLVNPSNVKNSYSQNIKIAGTPANDEIFGSIYRLDHIVSINNFNPLIRTPFMLVADTGELLEAGYVKLNSISRRGDEHYYNVMLFGALGGVFYTLSYDDEGNKMSLADLDYLGGGEDELTFAIDKNIVRTAWDEMPKFDGTIKDKWDVINFAPAYNGVPDAKNFDAKKALIAPAQMGNPTNVEGFTTKGDFSIMTMPNPATEWEIGDLRSYLQRPVISLPAIFKGIATALAKKGIIFIYPAIGNLWMTLPMMRNNGGGSKTNDYPTSMTPTLQYVTDNPLQAYRNDALPVDAKVYGNILFTIRTQFSADQGRFLTSKYQNEHCVTIVYANRAEEGETNVYVLGSLAGKLMYDVVASLFGQGFADSNLVRVGTDDSRWSRAGGNIYAFDAAIDMDLRMPLDPAKEIDINISTAYYRLEGDGSITDLGGGGSDLPYAFNEFAEFVRADEMTSYQISQDLYYHTDAVFSKSIITKKSLLSTDATPADYLLSYAKTFGYVFTYDKSAKRLEMMQREKFFNKEYPSTQTISPIDLSSRIDFSTMEIIPNFVDAKFFNFAFKPVEGEFEKKYKETYGREYGNQRVNTGYDFDSDIRQVMDKVVFKTAVTSLEQSLDFATYWNRDSMFIIPSPAMRGGCTYKLWKAGGAGAGEESKDFPILITEFQPQWYNQEHNGYDYKGANKLQLHDAGNKPVDGSNVLCFYGGMASVYNFQLTDDDDLMTELNGKPCWYAKKDNYLTGLTYPIFSRFLCGNESLDFGVPLEIDVPAEVYNPNHTIYSRRWRKFIADRYSVNSKVVRVNVDFTGVKVNEQLMRNFYWFSNSIWVLNKIINHSLTTDDLTECEFVKVQDLNNYLK